MGFPQDSSKKHDFKLVIVSHNYCDDEEIVDIFGHVLRNELDLLTA